MTKISIDVDLNKDPETILKEIQEKAESEMRKRKNKERIDAQLKGLHEKVNSTVGTRFSNINELVRALAVHTTPALRDRILGVTSTGRRKTITMNEELFQTIKERLTKGEDSKAQIARDLGVSPSQVRKVEKGGYDQKFGSSASVSQTREDIPREPEEESDLDEGTTDRDLAPEDEDEVNPHLSSLPSSTEDDMIQKPAPSTNPNLSKGKLSSSVTRPPIRRLEEDVDV